MPGLSTNRRSGRIALSLVVLTLVCLGALLAWDDWRPGSGSDQAGQKLTIAAGRGLYAEHCASCHGVDLEGQPNWRQRLANGRLPAPPHDETGHTWHHPDSVLFDITKHGSAALVGGSYESDMAGFGDSLSDEQIIAILDYIKSTWPESVYTRQAQINAASEGRGQ